MIQLIGFDGDDTLWHSEGYYQATHAEFERLLAKYVDLADARVHERLLATEQRNLRLFGYGAKGMTLSMIETAIEITTARIDAADVRQLLALGKQVLQHPVELLPGVRDAVARLAEGYRIVLITKGDLFHQEGKVARSGLADLFHRIEIVSEKDAPTYRRVLAEFDLAPERFAMIGNSLRSDIEPVLGLGAWAVYMPYHVTWAHETETGLDRADPRMLEVSSAMQWPAAVATLAASAGHC